MAPEQASGGLVDAHADLYSLTVVICEMLTGALPRQLGTGAPAGETRKLPSSALRLIHRGVASDPARRFQTARELRRELETLRTLMVRRTRPRPLSVRHRRPCRPLGRVRGLSMGLAFDQRCQVAGGDAFAIVRSFRSGASRTRHDRGHCGAAERIAPIADSTRGGRFAATKIPSKPRADSA